LLFSSKSQTANLYLFAFNFLTASFFVFFIETGFKVFDKQFFSIKKYSLKILYLIKLPFKAIIFIIFIFFNLIAVSA
jgi:hypothetical protein